MSRCGPLLSLIFLLTSGCPAAPDGPDLRAAAPGGPFADCTPADTEALDPPCEEGLRCGLLLVGEPPYQGALTQCVPQAPQPLAEHAPCAFDLAAPAGPGQQARRLDRCAAGQGCVQTARGLRCERLCALRVPGQCGAGALCVLPAQVESVGFCAAPDGCQPVPPQKGCPAGEDGQPLPCYVLTEVREGEKKPGGGTYCLPRTRYGESKGELRSPCERAVNCQAGLSCVRTEGEVQAGCSPYCAPPADGGMADGGSRCAGDLGTCHPIPAYERVGRCY